MEEIVAMAKANVDETLHEPFDPEYVRQAVRDYLQHCTSTFFVVDTGAGHVIAFLQAMMFGYDYRAGLYTVQKVLYVKPEKRGSRAAAILMKHLIAWSKEIGADRIEGGNDNGFKSERTAAFLQHFGFGKVGFAMRMKLDGHDGR